ncbi:unnamed protein product, partial [Allacma fusca]
TFVSIVVMDRESILKPPILPKPMSPDRVLKYKVQGDIHKRFGPTFGKSYVSVPTKEFVKIMVTSVLVIECYILY